MALGFELINNICTPVWKISGLLNPNTRSELLSDFQSYSQSAFSVATTGKKLSLEHDSKLGSKLFEKSSFQMLAETVTSSEMLIMISNLMKTTNSKYNDILPSRSSILKPLKVGPRKGSLVPSNDLKSIWFPNLTSVYKKVAPIYCNYLYASRFNCLPFTPRMQFSIMQRGTFIPPHTDITNKIATLMIYLPDSKHQVNSLLGTTFWNPKDANKHLISQAESKFLRGDDLSLFKKHYEPIRTKFDDYYCILFFQTEDSWHSFEHDDILGENRFSVNINYNYYLG